MSDFEKAIMQTKDKLTTTDGLESSYVVNVKKEVYRLAYEFHCNKLIVNEIIQMIDDRKMKNFRLKNGAVRTILSEFYRRQLTYKD